MKRKRSGPIAYNDRGYRGQDKILGSQFVKLEQVVTLRVANERDVGHEIAMNGLFWYLLSTYSSLFPGVKFFGVSSLECIQGLGPATNF